MIKRKARKPKFPKTANTFSKPSKRFIANVTQQIASASIFKKPKPDPIKALLKLVLCSGVEGKCVYLNDYRIVGPKPWGGGTIIQEWQFDLECLATALGPDNCRAIAALGRKK